MMPDGLCFDKQQKTRLKVPVLGMSESILPEQRSIAVVVINPSQKDSEKESISVPTVD